jgi:hypothetical protein
MLQAIEHNNDQDNKIQDGKCPADNREIHLHKT